MYLNPKVPKPDTKSKKQKNVMRYVSGSDPTKKASMPVKKPEPYRA